MPVTAQTLNNLAEFGTPTIGDVIELFGVVARNRCYLDSRIRSALADLPPMIGIAATACFRADAPTASRTLDRDGASVFDQGGAAQPNVSMRRRPQRVRQPQSVWLLPTEDALAWFKFKLPKQIVRQCKDTDQASAALVIGLKQRGLLDDTLIVGGGEFGRTVYCQGTLTANDYGRDHHPRCFTIWLCGGGIKSGVTIGATDDFCYNISGVIAT